MTLQDIINASVPTTNGPASNASMSLSEPDMPVAGNPLGELDAIEVALADALAKAAAAGRFDIVEQLARELEARRLARSNIGQLHGKRQRRDEHR